MQYYEQDIEDEISDTSQDDSPLKRCMTAPAGPLTEFEEFKRSPEYDLLEKAYRLSSQLVQRDFHKYDLDNPEGQKQCKKFLQNLEKMCEVYQVKVESREYRNHFSKAYKILYTQNKLCYLTEILDSAQEGFPYLWVNSEKYSFTLEVLEAGIKLVDAFYKVQHAIRHLYTNTLQESPDFQRSNLILEIQYLLENFDDIWVQFEKLYVKELMEIEGKARRFILQAIQIDKEMQSIEIREKLRGKILVTSESYLQLKTAFCKVLAQINSVANVEGKGRDDLGVNILLEAEGITRRVTQEQSKAVRRLADSIKMNFKKFREQMRKYEENIEMVDPQLKNNSELVELLVEYETQWEKGLHYLLEPRKYIQLMLFSHIIETTAEKHIQFAEQLECRDSDIFVTIPCLIVLKHLENEDKNICKYFLPMLDDENSKLYSQFEQLRQDFMNFRDQHAKQYEYYNLIEKKLLGIGQNDICEQVNVQIDRIMQKIRLLSIEIQRYNAIEWNLFIDAAINT
ncbi:unnamed protein product (macronuclear) [Paramecium tetraurelia]|uniref:Uncharacterized protein n=1 Tax=Paramecium tetraurelia TaxID=5888 RepID=A0BI58_PARTE|nr:uncharacterized protein GSPATT00029261001 [Paramecium tetraurelia]CAK58225.1 unnamed protein product [Paramecium tetraurelia]|eukprot:XP_001425623.1 hypothetical protein (macronuclear) [Paramecium tetraurelia strain d4-2]